MANALVVRGLSKAFAGLRAVDCVSLDVRSGSVHSLIGPNGAGKTTAFNCISGFIKPDDGTVLLNDVDVTGWPPHRLVAAGLARTFQVTNVFGELEVRENVALAARSRRGENLRIWRRASDDWTRVNELLELLGLEDHARVPANQLAHGDRRVLEIAIALALEPTVLLLDEPTAGMSDVETGRVETLIRRIGRTTAVLLVEHDMEMVLGISDTITVMMQGGVIADGTPDQISRDTRVQDAYLGAFDAMRP